MPHLAHDFSRISVHRGSPAHLQAKLNTNSPGDVDEQEADRVAEQVTGMAEPRPRGCGDEAACPASRVKIPAATARTGARRSSGQPLDQATRGFMERRFGHDFGDVRVHTDARSSAVAAAFNARAFTIGNDVTFAVGEYAPASLVGRRLLAHELTHVVQQRQASTPSQVMRKPPTSEPKWPSGGIQVIGPDSGALVTILETCTGVSMSLDKQGMLVVGKRKPKGAKGGSAAAEALRQQAENKTFGIIIDTDPAAEAVAVGAFSHEFPGYQSIDVANVKVMAQAPGVAGGLDACSAVLHEITEAAAGRAAAREGKLKGDELFKAAHGKGVAVEEKIRTEAGFPLRSTSEGSTQLLGTEVADKQLLLLQSIIFGSGKATRTQLTLVRFVLGAPKGGGKISGDYNVIASYVVDGAEKFGTQREAILVFNKYASKFGFKPLKVPAE